MAKAWQPLHCCWSEYFLRSWFSSSQVKSASPSKDGKSSSSHGESTLIFHLPFRPVSCCFLAAPRSQSVRGWQVRQAKFLSDRGTKFQLLPSLFPVWQSADALLQQMFLPCPSSSVRSVLSPVGVVTVELLLWPTGSWYVQVQDTKNLDL